MVKRIYKITPHGKSTNVSKQPETEFIKQPNNSTAYTGDTLDLVEIKGTPRIGDKDTHTEDIDVKPNIYNGKEAHNGDCQDHKDGGPEIAIYGRRWYILAVFSLISFTQAAVWNTWGPIAVSCEKAFGWDDTILALLPNWGPIGSILTGWVASWSMDVQGIRMCCVIIAALTAISSAIRCIALEPPYITWTANISAFLNGLGGPVAMGASPVLSAAWFPPNQRITSTAIATLFNYGGVAASFLIGPLFERNDVLNTSHIGNLTQHDNRTMATNSNLIHDQDESEVAWIRHRITLVFYAECGWCFLLLIMVVVFFPSKPPKPPSTTASKERLDIKSGFRKLMRNKKFLQLCLAYGLPVGITALWAGTLSVDLKSYDVSETQAGWIGFYSIIAGCFGCLVMARLSDMFSKHIRQILIFLYSVAFLDYLWFNLILVDIIPRSIAHIYVSIIVGTLVVNASVPLWMEMACEITYPIAEGITTVVMLMVLNIVGLVFLGIQMIPNIGTAWENWSILGSIGVGIPVLLLMDDSYNRLSVDETISEKK
ncbi:solute carrier family 49 member 4 homolog [Pecten maximus]|uniref:solute carrier family 49 member 4 homolog n=1 Tax=Pecten maximus TaxID=6579 RepID=UPI0014580112|nr:solute carrier family 49 member 4 homolog [Pecten maximus]